MIAQYSVFNNYWKMLTLANVNEKYLTLNFSKEPNFIFTFLVKSYTSFIYPNSQAYFFYMWHFTMSELLCNMLLCRRFDITDPKFQRVSRRDFQPEGCDVGPVV